VVTSWDKETRSWNFDGWPTEPGAELGISGTRFEGRNRKGVNRCRLAHRFRPG